MLSEVIGLVGFWGRLLDGAVMTATVSIAALGGGLILSMILAGMKLSRLWILVWPAEALTTLVRGIPELLLILFVYYGVPLLLNDQLLIPNGLAPITLEPFMAGVIALSIDFAAYGNEVFRSVFLAFPKGQVEAARACGMGPLKTFRRIILPQIWAPAIPPLGNLWMVLLKASALVSAISLEETMRAADIARQVTKDPFVWYGAAALIFLFFTFVSEIGQKRIEVWANRGKRTAN